MLVTNLERQAVLAQPGHGLDGAGYRLLLDVQHAVEIDQQRAYILEHRSHHRRSPTAVGSNDERELRGPSFLRRGRVACWVVPDGPGGKLDRRVVQAAEAALAQRRFVTAIDVLVGLGGSSRAGWMTGARGGSRIWRRP